MAKQESISLKDIKAYFFIPPDPYPLKDKIRLIPIVWFVMALLVLILYLIIIIYYSNLTPVISVLTTISMTCLF